jgi:hypothetical protein
VTNRSNKGQGSGGGFDFDTLLHPADAFGDPMAIVNDPDLTFNEKRTLLSSWASATRALEVAGPRAPGHRVINFDDIMDALRALHRAVGAIRTLPRYRRVLANRTRGTIARKRQGPTPDEGRSVG